MSVFAGLDGGSTYLKAALIDRNGRVLRTGVRSTGRCCWSSFAVKSEWIGRNIPWRPVTAAKSWKWRTTM